MATKGKKARKTTVKINKISKSGKQLGKGDMKKIKGGTLTKELLGTLVPSNAPKSRTP